MSRSYGSRNGSSLSRSYSGYRGSNLGSTSRSLSRSYGSLRNYTGSRSGYSRNRSGNYNRYGYNGSRSGRNYSRYGYGGNRYVYGGSRYGYGRGYGYGYYPRYGFGYNSLLFGLGYGGIGRYGYGYGYPRYGYGGYGGYGYGNGYATTTNNYYSTQPTTVLNTTEEPTSTPSADTQVNSQVSDQADEYYSAAYDAFKAGDYDKALRFASHAAVEAPNHPQIHELLSLALFAKGEYQGANMEAHAALAEGDVSDWPTLYAHYGNLQTYTGQLDKLKAFAKENPKAAEAQFLLAYHNMMMGHKEAAQRNLKQVLSAVPQDEIARDLMTQAGGDPGPAPEPRETAKPPMSEGIDPPVNVTPGSAAPELPAEAEVPAEPMATPAE